MLEKVELDELPLPTEHATLFELLCIVRVLQSLCPRSAAVRWLDPHSNSNVICVSGARCSYQRAIDRECLLRSGEYPTEVIEAIGRHGVSLPKFIDILFEFESPRAGFHGILLECKSGEQDFDAALNQLRAYRAALRERWPSPLLVWGITEKVYPIEETLHALEVAQREGDGARTKDLWFFSSAATIPQVLHRLGISEEIRRQ